MWKLWKSGAGERHLHFLFIARRSTIRAVDMKSEICQNNSILAERMGKGDGVNLRSKLMPSKARRGPTACGSYCLKQRIFFPLQG